jgi:uncharacterized protein (DUF302 family)
MEGFKTVQSQFGPEETMSLLENEIRTRGIKVFSRINHAALAVEAGQTLRPTEVIIFGNPKAGTPLMQAQQTIGIDLPLKMLVWQDAAGKTWLSYVDPTWLAQRHEVTGADRTVAAMNLLLSEIAAKATQAP